MGLLLIEKNTASITVRRSSAFMDTHTLNEIGNCVFYHGFPLIVSTLYRYRLKYSMSAQTSLEIRQYNDRPLSQL